MPLGLRNDLESGSQKYQDSGPGVVAHTYHPSTLGGSLGQEIETILVNIVKPHLY